MRPYYKYAILSLAILSLAIAAVMLPQAAAANPACWQASSCTSSYPPFISQAAFSKTLPTLAGAPVNTKTTPYGVSTMGVFMTKTSNRSSNFNIPPGTDVKFTIRFNVPTTYRGVRVNGGLVQDYVPPGWLLDVDSIKLDGNPIRPDAVAATSSGNFFQRGTFRPGTYIPTGSHTLTFVARTPIWPDPSSGNDVARLWVLARIGTTNQAALIDQSVVPVSVRGTGIFST